LAAALHSEPTAGPPCPHVSWVHAHMPALIKSWNLVAA